MNFGSYLVVVGAGISLVMQQVLNANLRGQIGSPWWAGAINYLCGALVMLSMTAAFGEPWLTKDVVVRVPWYSWLGGFFGAIFIGSAIFMVPRLGAATVVALFVVGQMFGSLAFDHFGFLGVPQHDANPVRLAGAACLILGVVLIRY
jgi:bacterial/archaeal transporter family-2 protein